MASYLRRASTSLYHQCAASVLLRQPRRHLPVCTVQTNQPRSAIPADFNTRLAGILAHTLGKDIKLVSVGLHTSVEMTRGKDDQPNALVQVWSFGVFDQERNPQYVQAMYHYLIPSLGMPADRIALFLHPIAKEDAGHLTYAQMNNTSS